MHVLEFAYVHACKFVTMSVSYSIICYCACECVCMRGCARGNVCLLGDVSPVPPQYASAVRSYFVRTWLLAFFNTTARFPSLSDRVACTDVLSS